MTAEQITALKPKITKITKIAKIAKAHFLDPELKITPVFRGKAIAAFYEAISQEPLTDDSLKAAVMAGYKAAKVQIIALEDAVII